MSMFPANTLQALLIQHASRNWFVHPVIEDISPGREYFEGKGMIVSGMIPGKAPYVMQIALTEDALHGVRLRATIPSFYGLYLRHSSEVWETHIPQVDLTIPGLAAAGAYLVRLVSVGFPDVTHEPPFQGAYKDVAMMLSWMTRHGVPQEAAQTQLDKFKFGV